MRLFLDTHLLLSAALKPEALSARALDYMGDVRNELSFSVVSLWETVIKLGRDRTDFQVDPVDFRNNLLLSGYREVEVSAAHILAVRNLPSIHGDPFDRLLLAQNHIEGTTFLTADAVVARYPGAILKV